jgi:predicted ATPase
MVYTQISIENYKGIKKLDISLANVNTKIFTLVGLNESGKTTILEAISLLNIQGTNYNVNNFIPKNQRHNFNGTVDLTAKLEFEDNDIKRIEALLKSQNYYNISISKNVTLFKVYQFENSKHKLGSNRRLCLLDIQASKGRSRKIIDVERGGGTEIVFSKIENLVLNELLPPILYYPNFLFDFPEKIYLEQQDNESEEQPTYREVISDILNSIDPSLDITTHIINRIQDRSTDAKRNVDAMLLKMSSKVTKMVFTAWNAIFDSHGKEIVIGYNEEEDGRIYLEFNLKEHSNYYQISERSLGFRWFFTFLLFTEFRKNRSSNSGEILFMLDEPASNLHSTAQKKLLETFEQILSNAKLIYTTHSHHLINPKWLSGVYIVRNRSLDYNNEFAYDNETTDIEALLYKKFVAKHPNQKSYFQPILDTLDYQPGLLEEVPYMILTEGKSDFYILKYLALIIDAQKYSKLNIYPGGGANRNSQTISLYLGWSKPFLIFLDSDAGGKNAIKTYTKEFGKIIEESVKTFKDVSPRFDDFAVEDLFSSDDKLLVSRIYKEDAIEYKKSLFNTGIEFLYISNNFISFSDETTNNFKKVLDFLVDSVKDMENDRNRL